MIEDAKPKVSRKKEAHTLDSQQWEYFDTLAEAGGFKSFPAFFKVGYESWKIVRGKYPARSRFYKFIVAEDGQHVDIVPNRKELCY